MSSFGMVAMFYVFDRIASGSNELLSKGAHIWPAVFSGNKITFDRDPSSKNVLTPSADDFQPSVKLPDIE
jgi:hypothetical protein